MGQSYNRRKFIRNATLAGVALGISKKGNAAFGTSGFSKKRNHMKPGKRIGIIGLDTSHSVAFTAALNDSLAD
ncbi:MAG: twin-arginine translocation signal domain-containing protein, partial [Ginsengibacter sp.]